MRCIKALRIEGFKKFNEITVASFNDHMNIFVGENEAGKSTILKLLLQIYIAREHMF